MRKPGSEPIRNGRDERELQSRLPLGSLMLNASAAHGKREKDDRSRQRESPPLSRREKDDSRRDRERFNDGDDDNRRWREDGRRRSERSRDLRDEDGWTLSEDRRRGGRDRKLGDAREREERLEREKEKEPAWMETYVPPSASAGILGGKGAEGEVDDIQAWKKDMKEREMKSKAVPTESSTVALEPLEPIEPSERTEAPKPVAEGQLDEIQLFKLMMKKEEQKRAGNAAVDSSGDASDRSIDNGLQKPVDGAAPGVMDVRDSISSENLKGM